MSGMTKPSLANAPITLADLVIVGTLVAVAVVIVPPVMKRLMPQATESAAALPKPQAALTRGPLVDLAALAEYAKTHQAAVVDKAPATA